VVKIHLNVETMETEKKGYALLSLSSNVPVEFSIGGKVYSIVPYKIGEETLLIEYTADEFDTMLQTLTKEHLIHQVLKMNVYPDAIKNIVPHLKIGLRKFRILVVKYKSVEERELSRYSLSNVTFGVVNTDFEGENLDVHLLPSNVKVRTKEGYFLSGVVDEVEEGLREAFLLSKWFKGGSYEELVALALKEESEYLKRLINNWGKLLGFILHIDMLKLLNDSSKEFYVGQIMKKLRIFKIETLFNPFINLEMVALGVLLAKYGGGGRVEPDSYDII